MRNLLDRLRTASGGFLLFAVVGCGAGDLTLPVPPDAGDFSISPIGASDRSGRVGEALSDGLSVVVVDPAGEPAQGYQVAFFLPDGSSAGVLSPDTATTDKRGQAAAGWRLGFRPGSYLAHARLVSPGDTNAPVAEFRVLVVAGPPDTVRATSRLNQPGRRNQTVEEPPVVAVVDRYGNPVPNVNVAWAVADGGGSISDTLVATDEAGQSTVEWRLGNRSGVQKVTATVAGITGSPVVFSTAVLF